MQFQNRTQSESATQRGAIKKLHAPWLQHRSQFDTDCHCDKASPFFGHGYYPRWYRKSEQNKRVKPQKMRRMNILNYKQHNQMGRGERTGQRDMPETSQSRVDWESLGYIKRQQCDEAQSEIKRVTLQGLKCFFHSREKKKNRNEMKSKENKFIFQGIFHAVERKEG